MGRPRKPFARVVAETTYPVNIPPTSWDSTPVVTAPSQDYYTPGVPLAAQTLNYIDQQTTADAAAQANWTGQLDSMNWQPVQSSGSNAWVPYWDGVTGRWLSYSLSSSYSALQQSYDGVNWSAASSAQVHNSIPNSFAVRPTDGTIMSPQFASGPLVTFWYIPASGGAWTQAGFGSGTSLAGTPTNATMIWVSLTGGFSGWIWAGVDSVATSGNFVFRIAGVQTSGATFTGSSLPSSSGNLDLVYLPTDGTTVAAFATNLGTGLGSYVTSTDGATWTTHALPNTTTKFVSGAGYDDASGLWWIVESTGALGTTSSPTTNVWTSASPTGTWTLASTTAHAVATVAGYGAELVATMYVAGVWRLVVTVDYGVTWRLVPSKGALTAGSFGPNAQVLHSGQSFVLVDTTAETYQFSLATGLPSPVVV